MKNLKILFLSFCAIFLHLESGIGQNEASGSKPCPGYPKDESCCLDHKGLWMENDGSKFCYVNLLTSRATKLDCMNAGGYAYWKNDSTMLCIPRGTLVMTGDVSAVDETSKTIILMSDGNTFTVMAPQMGLPEAGQRIDLYYTVEPDDTIYGKTCHPAMMHATKREDN